MIKNGAGTADRSQQATFGSAPGRAMLVTGEESLPARDGWPMDLRHVLECL